MRKGWILAVLVLAVAALASLNYFIKPVLSLKPSFVVWHSYPDGSPQIEYIKKTAFPEIEARYQNIIATSAYCDEDVMYDQMALAKNEGTLPDVVFLTPGKMAGLAKAGALADLSSFGRTTEFSAILKDMPDSDITAGSIGGKVYGFPTEMSVQILLYNRALLLELEASVPSGMDSFWDVLETISSEEGGVAGLVLPGVSMRSLAPFVWSEGGELVDEDGTKSYGYLNNENNIEIFEKIAAALKDGLIAVADNETEALASVAAGEAAMTVMSTSGLDAFAGRYPGFEFGTATFPSGAAGSVTALGCNFVCVTTDAGENVAAAFLTSIFSSGALKADVKNPISEAVLSTARPLPVSYLLKDMKNEFLPAMRQIAAGQKTAQEALDSLALKWDENLP